MWTVNLCVFLVLAISHFVASENAVICYYGSWATYRPGEGKFDVAQINTDLCTHLVYAFVGLDTEGNIVPVDSFLDLPEGDDNFNKFNALKEQNPSLITLVTIGGWIEKSANFSTMVANSTIRQNFIGNALDLVTAYAFDGLDIDWVYPGRRDTVQGSADIAAYTTLLKELREAFDAAGLLITAAVSAVKAAAVRSYDVAEISQYLDIVNIMTFDMNGAWHPVTGHNAPLYRGEGDEDVVEEDANTVEQALLYWISAGCPPEKIAVGVAFYGRTFVLSNATENGVRVPSSGVGIQGPYSRMDGILGYFEICQKLQSESWTQRFDSEALVPYAFKDNDWVSYDDADSIITKIEYARQLNITNVMVWSIENDDFQGLCGSGAYPLLTAINGAISTF